VSSQGAAISKECKVGKRESCGKLSQVNAKLEKDMNFLKTPAFLQGVR